VATGVIYQGARGAVVTFFVYGGKELVPPPPLDQSRAMLAAFLVTIALVLWVTIEQLGFSLDPMPKGKGKKPKRRRSSSAWGNVSGLVRDIFSAFGIAPAAGDLTGGDASRRKRRRG
jgi:hypothetical protein